MNDDELVKSYRERVLVLKEIAIEIKNILHELLSDKPRIDMITTRVKDPEKFLEKAKRVDKELKKPKYNYPLEEIQDQIGARVVVYYKSDIEPIRKKILLEFRKVEDKKIEPPDPDRFAYESHHFICFIPHDICCKCKPPIDFFELQIRTLFQHAWAQAEHDLGYKSQSELEYDDRKYIAWASAQAWGSDIILDKLWNKLNF